MSLAVEIVPTLLHFSVFLFFAGLVIFFFTIHKTVAIVVSISVGVFAVMYLALTVLPYFLDKCLYRTPMSGLFWYPWHASLFFASFCLHRVVHGIHSCLIPYNLGQGEDITPTQGKLYNWLKIYEGAYKKHGGRLKSGFRNSIIQEALRAPVDVDRDALTRLFSQLALADRSELLKFVASIPRDQFVHIMTPPIDSGKIVFRGPLLTIRNCVVDTSAAGLDDNKHKSCLLVWLAAVHHIAKEFFVPNRVPEIELGPLLDDVRINFANVGRMQALWAHGDTAIRVISRSICALLAKCLLKNRQPDATELLWLEAVIGVPGNELFKSLHNSSALDHLIFKSFVCGIFEHREGDIPNQGNLPLQEGSHHESELTAYASPIATTLAIVMGAGTGPHFNRVIFTEKLSNFIHQMEVGDPASLVANELRRMFPDFIQATSPAPTPAPVPAPQVSPAPAPHPAENTLRRLFRSLGLVGASAPGAPSGPVP
jgi:hypothetical protein